MTKSDLTKSVLLRNGVVRKRSAGKRHAKEPRLIRGQARVAGARRDGAGLSLSACSAGMAPTAQKEALVPRLTITPGDGPAH